jgi:hypothetical protein
MRRVAGAAFGFALALAATLAFAQDPRASVVGAAARDWLAHVDRGDAAAAHKAAGAKFREAMTLEVWSRAMVKERGDRGKLVQRSVVGTTFELPAKSAPPGEYAVVQFRTAFDLQSASNETITLEREKDGVWRVVGYTLR